MSIRQHTAALPNLLARLWHHLSRRRQFVLLMGSQADNFCERAD